MLLKAGLLLGGFIGLIPLLNADGLPQQVDFNREVRPILSDQCYSCHGPDSGQRKTAMRFDHEKSAKAELASGGYAIVPRQPDQSVLLQRLTSSDPLRRMPPFYMGHDPLPEESIDILRRWITQGAQWDRHWAFQVPQKPHVEPAITSGPTMNTVDVLVLQKLEQEGLGFSGEAAPTVLLRRAYLDLTGLPPTPEEVRKFLEDHSFESYESVIDGLLASPKYGEHMASMWLDAARYADTNGYQTDGTRSMWRWRDWVIDAFNSNMGFDRFTIEQLAGDMLPSAARDQIIATGFNRNHRTTAEGGSVSEEFRVEYVADRAETTATVWLGLTMGCARCHDHKFDPLSQKEYYQFFAYFNNVPEKGMVWNFGNDDPLIAAPTPEQELLLNKLVDAFSAAEKQWISLQTAIKQEQAHWETGLSEVAKIDWTPTSGLALHAPLDGRLELSSFTGGSIDGKSDPVPVKTMLVEGRLGNSAKFDGTRYIDLGAVGNYNYLDPVSISAWVYPTSKKDGAIVSSMTENPIGSGWGLFLRGGKLWWHMSQRWSDLSMRLETRQDIQLDRWQHVMLTYDGNRKPKGVHVYIDGVEQELNILFSNLDWPSKSNAPLKIGGGGGLDNRFTGLIDEVRLYGQSLSASQARALSVLEPLQEIAAISHDKRSNAQQDKLDLAFLDTASSPNIRQSRQQYEEAQRTLAAYRKTLPTVMVMQEGEQKQAYVLNRGRYDAHGEPVQADVPSALAAGDKDAVGNRLQLARWIASRSNPLTARVIVNRFWQMFFGTGIVKTVDDFGSQGESPSNQPLLDWLAVEFMDSGWDVKHLLKTIMLSRTFRQTSRVSPELQELDPDNRLLARGPRFRLSAGTIRDQALAVAGLLKQQQGGPSVRPYQPPGLWQEVSGETYEPGSGNDLYRRSLYTYWKRTVAPPSMVNFDASDREVCSVYVNRTNTPLQALNLMNDPTFIEAARKFAERLLHDPSQSVPKRIELAYLYAVNRLPHDHETTILANLLQTYQQMYADDLDTAEQFLAIGDSDWDRNLDARELAAYAGMASLILNLDEVVTKQ